MSNLYKYISKPYTLEELVNGSPIFKIHYDFFNSYFEWEQDQEKEKRNFNDKEQIELLFNEFLNIISLLIIDQTTYNEALKNIALKSEQIEMFYFMARCIPLILDEHPFLYETSIPEKTQIYLDKLSNSEEIKSNDLFSKETLYPIVQEYLNNIKITLTRENIIDLTNFFDVYLFSSVQEIINSTKLKLKRNNKDLFFFDGYKSFPTTKSKNIKPFLENISPSLSGLIFKTKGKEIFNLIVSKYPKEKNTAFFSYLYFYLKDDLKLLLVTGNDNKDYRDFIIEEFNISFSRIQKSKSENQYKREEIINLFKSYYSEM